MILEVEIPCYSVFLPGELSYIRKRCVVEKIPYIRYHMDNRADYAGWKTDVVVVRQPVPIPCSKVALDFLLKHIMHYPSLESIDYQVTDDTYAEAQAKTLQEIEDIWAVALFLQCDDFKDVMLHLMLRKLDAMPDAESDAFFATQSDWSKTMLNHYRWKKLHNGMRPVELPY